MMSPDPFKRQVGLSIKTKTKELRDRFFFSSSKCYDLLSPSIPLIYMLHENQDCIYYITQNLLLIYTYKETKKEKLFDEKFAQSLPLKS